MQQETNKQGQNYCYEKEKGFALAVGWKYTYPFPEGLIILLLLPGKVFNFFLQDDITEKNGHQISKLNWVAPTFRT